MENKEANTINLETKKAGKMLLRITIWGAISTGILITLIMLFVK